MSNTWSTLSNPDIEWQLAEDVELEPPYRVIIHNDDVTTFEFVIRVLQTIFGLNVMMAEQIANRTHTHGSAYVGTFPKSEAETKVNKTHFAAQLEGFPLRLTIEPEEI
ncbi:MAG: ATP-dependent Clp protease adaptor ClpS [Chloroflexi bacterium]|nr:ATP-dependent Clp protease adaptor ClpS [Chloroflexota bacterium]MDA0245897.1 ATP-dependent Clp protease adaptor ClpS [Chloroflexota bacterium]